MPPVATYSVKVEAPRHRSLSSASWQSTTGGLHDFGTLRIIRQQGYVSGTVIDTKGKPVAGARVTNSGDAETRLQAVTDAAGRFRLEGLEGGPCLLAVEGAGRPLSLHRVDTPVINARLVLRPRVLSPVPDSLVAARERLALEILGQVERETEGKKERAAERERLVSLIAARDPLRATELAEATGSAARDTLSFQLARLALKRSVDEAIACARQIENPWWRAHRLLELAASAPEAQAPKLVSAAVGAARGVPELIWQLYLLAECGDRMRVLKMPGAETLLRDCAARASLLGVKEGEGYTRGIVAERLSEIDLDAAMGLIAPMTEKDARNRHIGNIAVRYSVRSLEQSLRMLEAAGMEDWRSNSILARMCARLARSHADRGVRLVERLRDRRYRLNALLWMAERITDRKQAHAQLMRADRELKEWEAAGDGGNSYDSPALHLAHAALVGKRIGYPGAAGLLARALAARPALTSRYGDSQEQQQLQSKLAVVAALVDPVMGKEIADIVLRRLGDVKIPKQEWMESQIRQEVLLAAAFTQPARAAEYLRGLKRNGAKVNSLDAAEVLLDDKKREAVVQGILGTGQPEGDE